LHEVRIKRGFTIEKVSRLLNLSQNEYAALEENIELLFAKHLVLLSEYYDVSVDYLLGITEEPGRI